MEEETVKLRYSSSTNISFHGWVDTGIPWSEWADMSDDDRQEEINVQLNYLVEMSEVPAGEDPDVASNPWRSFR